MKKIAVILLSLMLLSSCSLFLQVVPAEVFKNQYVGFVDNYFTHNSYSDNWDDLCAYDNGVIRFKGYSTSGEYYNISGTINLDSTSSSNFGSVDITYSKRSGSSYNKINSTNISYGNNRDILIYIASDAVSKIMRNGYYYTKDSLAPSLSGIQSCSFTRSLKDRMYNLNARKYKMRSLKYDIDYDGIRILESLNMDYYNYYNGYEYGKFQVEIRNGNFNMISADYASPDYF